MMRNVLTVLSLLLLLPASVYGAMWTVKIKNVGSELHIAMGDAFYFSGEDAGGPGLWKSDGTTAGTKLVKSMGERPVGFVNADGTLYFCGHETNTGYELWKSDGTPSGTSLVVDLNPGSDNGTGDHPNSCHIAYLDGKIFFSGFDNGPGGPGSGLWKK